MSLNSKKHPHPRVRPVRPVLLDTKAINDVSVSISRNVSVHLSCRVEKESPDVL